jgi:hypothetical protein
MLGVEPKPETGNRVQLEVRVKCYENGQWERRRPAGNALRINVEAILHSCRRDAGAPSKSPFKTGHDSHFQLHPRKPFFDMNPAGLKYNCIHLLGSIVTLGSRAIDVEASRYP